MSSPDGQQNIRSGWSRAGITDAIEMGSARLPSLDPFEDIDSLVTRENVTTELENIGIELVHPLASSNDNASPESSADSDSDWATGDSENEEERNAFDFFD